MHFAALAKCRRFIVSTHFHGVGHSVFRDALIRLLKPFGKRTLEKADKIVTVSEYEKSLLVKQFRLNPKKVVVIPAGVDFSEFEGLKRRKRGFRSILYIGRLVDYKGVQYLVEVLPKLPKDVVLEIVGKGSLKTVLEKRARELGVRGKVRFYQDLSRRELLQRFVDADVFALLSRYEAYSIAVAEALAAGTPCVVANASALSEWIDNKTCFGVDYPIRLDELADVVSHVLDDKVRVSVFSGKFVGEKILDWNEVTKRLENLYMD